MCILYNVNSDQLLSVEKLRIRLYRAEFTAPSISVDILKRHLLLIFLCLEYRQPLQQESTSANGMWNVECLSLFQKGKVRSVLCGK